MMQAEKYLFEILTKIAESETPIFIEDLNIQQYSALLYFLKFNPMANATRNILMLQLKTRILPADMVALILRDEILARGATNEN